MARFHVVRRGRVVERAKSRCISLLEKWKSGTGDSGVGGTQHRTVAPAESGSRLPSPLYFIPRIPLFDLFSLIVT